MAFTKNSTDQIALYEGLTALRGQRHRRRPSTLLQARDARPGPRRARPQHRAATQGPHHHARPLGRAARQGRHGAGRGLRSRLGDRRRPAALDGAPPRPRPDRSARRAGRGSVRPRALGAHFQAECPHGGDPRTTVRPAAGARRGGETGDPDRRRLRRRDQRAVPPSRSRAAPLDTDGRRRRGWADRGGVRRGRRRRGAALQVPRRAPAKARRRERATRVGRPPPAKRSRGTRRSPLGGHDLWRTERDRERRGRRRAGYEPCAPGEPSDDVERTGRRRRVARPRATRSSSPGRRSVTSIPASCSSSISRAAGTRHAAWPSRVSRSRFSWAVGSTTPGARRRPDPTSSTSTSRRSAGAATRSYLWNGECREMTTFDAGTIVGRPASRIGRSSTGRRCTGPSAATRPSTEDVSLSRSSARRVAASSPRCRSSSSSRATRFARRRTSCAPRRGWSSPSTGSTPITATSPSSRAAAFPSARRPSTTASRRRGRASTSGGALRRPPRTLRRSTHRAA